MHGTNRCRQLLRRLSITTAAALAAAAGSSVAPAGMAGAAPAPASLCGTYASVQLGPNVCVFTPPSGADPAKDLAAIQTVVNNIAAQQVPMSAQFNDEGYALLFEPGTYGSSADPLVFQVGYYTEVAGLGAVPQDTTVNGLIESFANGVNSDVNFWRSLSNLTLNVVTGTSPTFEPPIRDAYGAGCADSEETWSVSQAAPLRSVVVNGNINFQDYCLPNDYASGTYVANSVINGQLDWSGNQQGIARNSDFESAAGYVWNYVYSGDACPPGYTPPAGTACSPTEDIFNGKFDTTNGKDGVIGVDQVTELPQSPVTEEEPFLYTTTSTATTMPAMSNGVSGVFVPAVEHNSVGPNFLTGTEAGATVPLSAFFIANPSTPEGQIQAALDRGHDLVLTPGVYNLGAPIDINRPGTIVLGLGFPVLVPQRGNPSMIVRPDYGVKLSGMIFDAGPVNSPVLLSVGTPYSRGSRRPGVQPQPSDHGLFSNRARDPDLIQDLFFRVGGAETTPVSATVSLIDNADNSIIDDVWAWRADHGANTSVTNAQGQEGAGWTYNQGATGLEVTGNNVTAYGLAVEHYQKNEVIWSGNDGTDIFFQNELPYDPPNQMAWETSQVQPGYPSFLVPNNVQSFHGYGMGSYVVFIYTPATLWDAMAYEVPDNSGVVLTDVFDLFISSTCSVNKDCPTASQSGGLDSVVDGVGGSATNANPTAVVDVNSYSNGVATLPSS